MKNLRGSLVLENVANEQESYSFKIVPTIFYGDGSDTYTMIDKHRRSENICCVCEDNMWVRDTGVATWLIGQKVLDARAYVGGTPDYLNLKNSLLEVHDECLDELNKRLDVGLFMSNLPL